MERRSGWSVVAGCVVVSVLGACADHAPPPAAERPDKISAYFWIDRLPEKDTQFFHGLRVLGALPIAAFIRASSYQAFTERADVLRDGNHLRLRFPQTEKKAELTFQIVKCDAPEPLANVCLELSKNPWGGPRRYHGLELKRAAALPELAGLLATMPADQEPADE